MRGTFGRWYAVNLRVFYTSSLDFSFISPPDLEWRLIYVSSPGNEALDQELDDCLLGPVPVGLNSFEFEATPPDPKIIPKEDVLGVAALILTGLYKDQEFVRVGYYQNTEYDTQEMRDNPPDDVMFEALTRDIMAKPRVTRFLIKWWALEREPLFVATDVSTGMFLQHNQHRSLSVLHSQQQYRRLMTLIWGSHQRR